MSVIDCRNSLDSFFAELLGEALRTEKVEIAEGSREYLVQLFADFAHIEQLHRDRDARDAGTPTLAWLYEKAQCGEAAERFEAWRHLGDVALLVSGLFGPHLDRRRSLVGVDYYVRMGAGAYGTAATYARWQGFGRVLEELAQKFRTLVDVLTRVGEATTLPVANGLERLYERWLGSRDGEDLYRRLGAMGASPVLVGVGRA